jgi:hypothetical protein
MLVLHEMSFPGGVLMEVQLHDDLRYLLRYGDAVVYRDHQKTYQGRKYRYDFRSVEQLRYDFERDVAAAGGRVGENP